MESEIEVVNAGENAPVRFEMSDERTDNKDVDDFDLTKQYFVESIADCRNRGFLTDE